MASVVNDPNGRKRISYKAGGKRRTLRLGDVPQEVAEDYADKIGRIIACLSAPHLLSIDVIQWAADLQDRVYQQLAAAGLVPARTARRVRTLEQFLEEYFGALQVKPSTRTSYSHTRRCLLLFFGKRLELAAIGAREADGFHAWLGTHDFAERKPGRGSAASGYRKIEAGEPRKLTPRKLRPATISRRALCARHIFNKALRWGYIKTNPFAGVKCGQQRNEARKFFVPRASIDKAIEECADPQWKLIIALSRYGGLRCPSEHLALKWTDVNLERGTMVVHSSKTEHHVGGESRIVPIFPELRPHLEAVLLDEREESAVFVITRYRGAATNLRSQFLRILKRAGVKPWPRLFQNLRASRETELIREYPLETACGWIGNTPQVAVVHYLNDPDKDDHFQRAIKDSVPPEVTRNPTRAIAQDREKLVKMEVPAHAKTAVEAEKTANAAADDWAMRDANIPQNPAGPERPANSDAQSDARPGPGPENFKFPKATINSEGVITSVTAYSRGPDFDPPSPPPPDPLLEHLASFWPSLTQATRESLVALAAAAAKGGG